MLAEYNVNVTVLYQLSIGLAYFYGILSKNLKLCSKKKSNSIVLKYCILHSVFYRRLLIYILIYLNRIFRLQPYFSTLPLVSYWNFISTVLLLSYCFTIRFSRFLTAFSLTLFLKSMLDKSQRNLFDPYFFLQEQLSQV